MGFQLGATLGTAPRKVKGSWVTRGGRTLTSAGQHYWEGLYQTGRTDALGHMHAAPGMGTYVAGPQTLAAAGPPPKHPDFNTVLKATKGDLKAQAQVNLYASSQRAQNQATAQRQAQLDANLFGSSLSTVHKSAAKTKPSPLALGLINAVSPVTAAQEAFQAAQKGNLLGTGIAAAGLFPFGKFGRAAKVAEDAAKARRVAKVTADLTPEQKVLRSTGKARELRAQQKKLYSAERARRAGLAEAANQAGGMAGYHAALVTLKGELPKLRFDQLTNITDSETDRLFTIIQQHPALQPYEKISLQGALLQAREGRVPAPYEIKLIEKAFGPDVAAQARKLTPLRKAGRAAAEVINVPRSLLSSFDVSAPFRQGLVAGASHPRIFARNFGPMFKALVSEKQYGSIMQEIADRPSFPAMQDARLQLTGLGDISRREEQFMSNLAEKIPVVGRGVRASSRAYVGFLNRMRADMFDHLIATARAEGIETPKLRRDVARFVNVATGRGELGPLEPAAVALNTTLFSPRLFASRINMLNPVFYGSLDPFARKQALKSVMRLAAAGMTVLGLMKLAGAKVSDDPRNSDFGKVRFGNTRLDIWGGHQQIVRLVSQVASGKIVSSTTGQTYRLTGGRSLSRRDITLRFFEGKLAPSPSLINDWFKGTDFADKPFSWKKAVVQRTIPLLAQDAHDLYSNTGSIPQAAGAYALGAFGIGIQTYGNKAKQPLKSKTKGGPSVLGGGGVNPNQTLPGFGSSPTSNSAFKLGGTLNP